jgi:stress response protein YsnF
VRAGVTEEISLRKDVTEHVETVKDTIRRDEARLSVPTKAEGARVVPVSLNLGVSLVQ